jgi:hypothetical protein
MWLSIKTTKQMLGSIKDLGCGCLTGVIITAAVVAVVLVARR